MSPNVRNKIIVIALAGLLAFFGGAFVQVKAADDHDPALFKSLQQRLGADGFDPVMIEKLYQRPQVRFDTKGVSTFFTYRESKLNYDQFTTWGSIRKARKYMEEHIGELEKAENRFGVDRYVITAVILVETKLGTYLGNRSILNTLSTMASLMDKDMRDKFWELIPPKNRISREKYEAKAKTKSSWAYRELKAFLKHALTEDIDPCAINGSFAGAMGIAQFMPSNVISLATDGNEDGRIDLFNHADAIASIGNYLHHHGWRPDQGSKKAYKVLLRYNYSKYYVNTILKVAERLRG